MARPKIKYKPVRKSKTPAQTFDKVCGACGSDFTTHKAKAARCDVCIAEDRKVTYRDCVSCGVRFANPHDDYHCEGCRVSIDPSAILKQIAATLERERTEERHLRIKQRLADQATALDHLERKPEGTKMTVKNAAMPIGILWLQIVHLDGGAAAASYLCDTGLTDDDFVRLVTSYHRLRCRGYQPHEIAKLCPNALLKSKAQEALRDLPKLSLEDDARDFEVAFTEDQARYADATALGLTASLAPVHHQN